MSIVNRKKTFNLKLFALLFLFYVLFPDQSSASVGGMGGLLYRLLGDELAQKVLAVGAVFWLIGSLLMLVKGGKK